MFLIKKNSDKRLQDLLVEALLAYEKVEQLNICRNYDVKPSKKQIKTLFNVDNDTHLEEIQKYLSEWSSLHKREKDALLELHFFDNEILLNDFPGDIFYKKKVKSLFKQGVFKSKKFYEEFKKEISEQLLTHTV